jgi:alpha,alpha-trehalase
MSATPIADHALISDCRSMALIDRTGSIEWLCWPRVDAPSVFGRILDANAGHWSIAIDSAINVERRYLDMTMVLETTFTTPRGTAILTDALATGAGERGHQLGRKSPRLLIRQLSGVSGSVDAVLDLAVRPEYGLVIPVVTRVDGGAHIQGGPAVMMLSSPVPLEHHDSRVLASFTIREGDVMTFGLQHRGTDEPPPRVWGNDELNRRLEGTVAGWRSWSRLHQRYEGPWREHVHHSGRVLQALTFAPTGAVVAAATTSLPEEPGGGRNWDYRYSWVRDASFTIEALWVAACPDEANRFWTAGSRWRRSSTLSTA